MLQFVRIMQVSNVRLLRGLVLGVGLAIATLFFSPQTFAATTDGGASAQGFQIAPAIYNLNADPGGSYTLKVTITNVTSHDLIATGEINDFTAKDETGSPKILTDSDEASLSPNISVKTWVSDIGTTKIASHATKTFNLTIKVPQKAEAGGHYGVIQFKGQPPELENQNVGLSASVGSLLLVRVSGNINENLSLSSLNVAKDSNNSNFFEGGPITIVSRFTNSGNVHVVPSGLITIKDMLGRTTASMPISADSGNVLPNSTRKFTQQFNKKWLFGHYTAHLSAVYGTSGKTVKGSVSFWVIPYKIIALLLIIVIAFIVLGKKMLKKYNQHVIKKYSHKD